MNTRLPKRPSLLFHLLTATVVSLQIVAPVWATCGGGGGGGSGGVGGGTAGEAYQVPWKLFKKGDKAPTVGWATYWFPASANEYAKSSLRSSRDLTLWASQGVSMIVDTDGSTPATKFMDATVKLPVVVLMDTKGNLIGRVDQTAGMLKVAAIEKLIKDELKKKETALTALEKEGAAKVKAKDNAGAIEAYQKVWDDRALFPRKGTAAKAALKKLGVTVADASLIVPDLDPIHDGAKATQVLTLMRQGLAAENAENYSAALKLYTQATRIDPADPTPARYLGELYRHVTGEWGKARAVFEAMLTQLLDPLSRAVALHGLGKMTIHEGRFLDGLHLLEASAAEFPTALANRNLAVYWNSEGDMPKAAAYTEAALKLDPEDPYNKLFGAVYLAMNGKKDEALKIAQESESMLAGSYNIAAIHAVAGNRDQALAYLKRHFFTYERYDAVRAEEMMEARVDEVFVSLRNDPEFLKLTAMADGMLPMKMTGH